MLYPSVFYCLILSYYILMHIMYITLQIYNVLGRRGVAQTSSRLASWLVGGAITSSFSLSCSTGIITQITLLYAPISNTWPHVVLHAVSHRSRCSTVPRLIYIYYVTTSHKFSHIDHFAPRSCILRHHVLHSAHIDGLSALYIHENLRIEMVMEDHGSLCALHGFCQRQN